MNRPHSIVETAGDRIGRLSCGEIRSTLRRLAWEELMHTYVTAEGGYVL